MAAGAVRDACRAALEERERRGARGRRRARLPPRRARTPLDPETGQVLGERAHVALAARRCASSSRSTSSSGSRGSSGSVPRRTSAALDPLRSTGQIEGGTAQGIGLALMEEIQTRDGRIRTRASPTTSSRRRSTCRRSSRCSSRIPSRTRRTASRASASRRPSSRPQPSSRRCATRPAGRCSACPCGRTRSALAGPGRAARAPRSRAVGITAIGSTTVPPRS